jgi:anti-sigma regulatory factor (Ser/Thr protein kinase)
MNVLSLEKEALRDNLEELFAFAEQALTRLNAPASDRDKMMAALDEALTNVVLYAYPEDPRGTVGIRICLNDNTITAEVVDHGKPFDPTAHPAPDITLPIEQRPIGGLGIHLMRNLVTSLRYYRDQGANHLVLSTSWGKTI